MKLRNVSILYPGFKTMQLLWLVYRWSPPGFWERFRFEQQTPSLLLIIVNSTSILFVMCANRKVISTFILKMQETSKQIARRSSTYILHDYITTVEQEATTNFICKMIAHYVFVVSKSYVNVRQGPDLKLVQIEWNNLCVPLSG